jgi:hypothetical protein
VVRTSHVFWLPQRLTASCIPPETAAIHTAERLNVWIFVSEIERAETLFEDS